ncbi:hypothetical protein U3516DRAFT_737623 [Neocallimastix sp. 'constans']
MSETGKGGQIAIKKYLNMSENTKFQPERRRIMYNIDFKRHTPYQKYNALKKLYIEDYEKRINDIKRELESGISLLISELNMLFNELEDLNRGASEHLKKVIPKNEISESTKGKP